MSLGLKELILYIDISLLDLDIIFCMILHTCWLFFKFHFHTHAELFWRKSFCHHPVSSNGIEVIVHNQDNIRNIDSRTYLKTREALKEWCLNTLRPRQNGYHFRGNIFKIIFLIEYVWISLKISLKFVPMVLIKKVFQHWFRLWLGADQAPSQYLNQCWLVYWRIYVSPGLNELTMQSALYVLMSRYH